MKYIIFEQGAYDDFCDRGIYDKARYIKIRLGQARNDQ
jgi:hypothetical protein